MSQQHEALSSPRDVFLTHTNPALAQQQALQQQQPGSMDAGTTQATPTSPTMATPASPMTTTPVEPGPTSPAMPTEAHTPLQGKEGAFQLKATDFQSSEVPHYFLTSGRKWLVCIDGSAESKLGLYHALDLMNTKEDSLILVHAIKKSRSLASRLSHWRGQSSQAESGEGAVASPEQQQQQQQQQQQPAEEQEPEPDAIKRGKGYLAHAGNLVKQWSDEVKWFTRCLEAKDPREALCELARDEKVDYIVMGSRGQNPIRSLFMGSVSSYVSSHAPCPVIVIRETEEERREKKAAELEERKAAASTRTEKRKKLRKKKRDEKKAQGLVEQPVDALQQQQMLMQQQPQLQQQPFEATFQQEQMGAQQLMLQPPLQPTFQPTTAETGKMMAPLPPEVTMGPAGTSGGTGEMTIPVMEK